MKNRLAYPRVYLTFFTGFCKIYRLARRPASIPLTTYLFGSGDIEMVTALMFMSMWLVMLHRDNISRLLAGTESKFSFKTRIS